MHTYPLGTVRALLKTDAVTASTQAALEKRLQPQAATPLKFFTDLQLETLRAAAARLITQKGRAEPIDVVREIDQRLCGGVGNGWRFAALPPDEEAYQLGLRGLEETASVLHQSTFAALSGEQQDDILRSLQTGTAAGGIWQTLDSPRFFEELLADLAEAYYSHPLAQEEIGYVGMADAPGWTRLGLNELEAREPRSKP